MFQMIYVMEDSDALVNEKGDEKSLKAGDFALVNPEGLTLVIPMRNTSIGTRVVSRSR
jgi:hypothetical protein